MDNAVKRLDVKDREVSEVFGWFKQYVIKSKTDVTISHPELVSNIQFSVKDLYLVYIRWKSFIS